MLNHIELAKECGAWIPDDDTECVTIEGDATFRPDQLAAFTNAVIEMCAKVAETQSGYKPEYRIRSLKVKD